MSFSRTIDDYQLLLLIRHNDSKAFGYLYDQFSAPLYGIICKLVRDEALAKEVLLQSFKSIWEQRKLYNPEKERLFAWMHNITRDVIMTSLKKSILNKTITRSAEDERHEFLFAHVN